MLRIRRIFNPYLDVNIQNIKKVKEIIAKQFPAISAAKIEEIEDQLIDPLKYQYQASLFLAEDINDNVKGFALLLYFPDLNFCYLDYLAVVPGRTSSGIGGALYRRVREEAESLDVSGIFLECLPDDPTLCSNPDDVLQNRKRLAFYEKYGARPIINTLYESKVKPEDDCPPYLVFDGLNHNDSITKDTARLIVKAILNRKYGDYCDDAYVEKVVESFRDDPVVLRSYKYVKSNEKKELHLNIDGTKISIWFYINDRHAIHHVRDKGYVESPVRVKSIHKELVKTGMFQEGEVFNYPDKYILDVHDPGYFRYFKRVCENLPEGKSVYPYVFPIRHASKAPKELSVRAGYYCIDTFTPLNKNAFLAARWGVNCSLSAADKIVSGARIAYVLTRPPGHHAERSVFGGFCYFNNCAIAAERMASLGKVAILDIDYHHGNGQQQIFYNRNDILTVSIHGHPSFAYPYFSGFSDENGEGSGLGYNQNYPLGEKASYETYSGYLKKALRRISEFNPLFLIVALGLDTAKGDPTGTWDFRPEDFFQTGKKIGELKLPTLIIQEGGYRSQSLGYNARAFFYGLMHSFTQA